MEVAVFLKRLIRYIFLVPALLPLASTADITPYDTIRANEFYFTSDVYYVDEDATTAVIEVGFIPGDRSYSGSVNYRTTDGTAVSGQDYIGVTNVLSFSGLAPTKTFSIPIQQDALNEGNETVQLVLWNSNAIITRSNATLIIVNKAPRPKLDLARTNNMLTLSWATNFTNCVLQKSSALAGTTWMDTATTTSMSNGRYHVTTPVVSNAFFRLKLNNSP